MASSSFEQLTELIKTMNDVTANTANTSDSRKEAAEVMSEAMKKVKGWVGEMR